jgi:putative transposase
MKLGRYFAEHYDVVVMEDISVKQLIGKSVRKLRMRLQDVAFYTLKEIVKYQMEKHGKKLTLVNPALNSKKCAKCG